MSRGGARPGADSRAEVYIIGYETARDLWRAAGEHGATDSECAAIDRLDRFEGTRDDVALLERLAKLANLPWGDMFNHSEDLF